MANNLFEVPKVLLAAELGSWPWWLQEQSHHASARALSQQGAQSGRRQRPHQLVDVWLDSSNKAEAAHLVQTSSKSASLAFLVGIAVLPRHSQNYFGDEREIGPQEIKFVLLDVYVCHWKHAFNGCFEKQVQTDNFANCLKGNSARNPS